MGTRKLKSKRFRHKKTKGRKLGGMVREDSPKKFKYPTGPIRIPTLDMSTSRIKLSDDRIKEFIRRELKPGPSIVNIPMPSSIAKEREYHAILIDIREDETLVSDWGGGREDSEYMNTPKWSNYKRLLEFLHTELDKPVRVVPVDKELYDQADCVHERNNGAGGCSYYIYEWAKRYYPDDR